jgi:hypothetical protein
LGPIPNPQSPIPNPQSPIPISRVVLTHKNITNGEIIENLFHFFLETKGKKKILFLKKNYFLFILINSVLLLNWINYAIDEYV